MEYFRLLFPRATVELPEAGSDGLLCNNQRLFSSPAFASAHSRLGPNFRFAEELVVFGSGPNRLRVLWFRTHDTTEGKAVGPVALVRTTEQFAQVFALGVFEGQADTSRVGVERIGDDLVVTAVDDGCAAAKPGAACDSILHLYRTELGQLQEITNVPVERVRRSEPLDDTPAYASVDSVTIRLEAAPSYEGSNVKVLEQVTTVLAGGKELSKAERERVMSYYDDRVQWSEPSLWDRVYTESAAAPAQ